MPMETSMPIGIRPTQQTKDTSGTSAVTRRDGGSSPFAPQTNVNIKNSIADMAGVLSKISSGQEGTVEAMPLRIKEMVENIMRQAFSVGNTIGEGLGSTIESQRFSVEQLAALARMLSQLASSGEKSGLPELGEELQNFLKCLRSYLSASDSSLEPVLLHKLAFQLLNAGSEEDIPKNLQNMLQTEAESAAPEQWKETPSGREGRSLNSKFSAVRQLIRSFMPQAEATRQTAETANGDLSKASDTPIENKTEQPPDKKLDSIAKEPVRENSAREGTAGKEAVLPEDSKESPAFSGKEAASKTEDKAAGGKELTAENRETKTAPDGSKTENGQNKASDNATDAKKQPLERSTSGKNTAAEQGLPGRNSTVPAKESMMNAKAVLDQLQQIRRQIADSKSLQEQVSNKTLSQPMENTAKTMETMKGLAGLLLKDAEVTPQEAELLQKFVNDEQAALPEKEAKQLQRLLRLCESNVPASVRQAGKQNNLPDLPKLWAFMELCDLASLKEQTPRSLKTASRSVADFASAMKGEMQGESANRAEGQRSMSFMMPLYLGDNAQSYPAYIHVYDENKKQENSAEVKKETWLRLCLLTENIGAVELTCRVYDGKKLDVRVFFSQTETVNGFKEYIPEFEASFENSPLELADLKVGVAGTKL